MLNKRLQILAGYIAIVAVLLLTGHQPDLAPTSESNAPAAVAAEALDPANTLRLTPFGATYATEGILSVVYGDHEPSAPEAQQTVVSLIEADGDVFPLSNMDYETLRLLNGDEISVTGWFMDGDPTRTDDAPLLHVDAVTPLQADAYDNQAVEGNEKWLNLACRFGDMPDETPQPREYFQNMMQNDAPGMDHYWRQTSAGLVNIEGSASYGWFNLPRDKTYYVRAASVNTGFALNQILNDCVTVATESESIDLLQFGGINVMLNDTFGCCAWGGRHPVRVEGKSVTFRTTWLPPWAFNSLHVIAHEMGHGWGLPHSSGPYGAVYDSAWDVMSGGTRMIDVCRIGREDLGCYQVGTIGYHLAMLGWIPDSRIVTVNPGESAVITLDSLTTVRSGMDALLIKIPVDRSDVFYTVEARNFIGYDRNIPGEAIVLHEVSPNRQSPAHVVDPDNNGNPNDEGAMWLPGETFTDRKTGIRVDVLARLGSTFTVQVSNNG